MHIKKSIILFYSTILISLCMASCEGGQQEKHEEVKAPEKKEVSQANEGNETIQAYLQLKDGLVQSDSQTAKVSAKKLIASLDNMDGPEVKIIRESAMNILNTTDLDEQRKAFKSVSDAVAELASKKDMGLKLYKQFCPMAFDNAGGYWLSAEQEINNPYFGKKMLHCGVVEEEI